MRDQPEYPRRRQSRSYASRLDQLLCRRLCVIRVACSSLPSDTAPLLAASTDSANVTPCDLYGHVTHPGHMPLPRPSALRGRALGDQRLGAIHAVAKLGAVQSDYGFDPTALA